MYHIIVNPGARSGRGQKYWEKIKNVFEKQNTSYQVHFTKKHGDAAAIAKDLYNTFQARNELLNLVILGGDGTTNEVLQGLPAFSNVCLSVIPVGSSNDFARDIPISKDVEEATEHILLKPTTLYMDIGIMHCENTLVRDGRMSIPDRRFAVSSGAGYDAAICHEALSSGIKDFFNRIGLGKLTYLMISLKQLMKTKPVVGELTLGDSETIIHLDKMLFVAAMNTKYEGGGFMFAPDACKYDGMLDLCCVSNLSRRKVLKALPMALEGKHFSVEGIDFFRVKNYTLRTSAPVWIHTDGEVEEKADFISYSVLKEALRLVY